MICDMSHVYDFDDCVYCKYRYWEKDDCPHALPDNEGVISGNSLHCLEFCETDHGLPNTTGAPYHEPGG